MFLPALVTAVTLVAASVGQADADCAAPQGTQSLLRATSGHLMLVGETHGNEQSPAFVQSLICLAIRDGESVTLALEMFHSEQDRIETYLDSDGSSEAVDALVQPSIFWNGRSRDGRSSQAMLGLIEYVRHARQSGAEIGILAADYHPETDPDLEQAAFVRDRAMARRLEAVAPQADRTIFLGGNVHTRRQATELHGQRLESIGSLIQHTAFKSILAVTSTGESWSCRGNEDGTSNCGVSQDGGDFVTGPPRLLSNEEFDQSAYAEFFRDGYDYLVFLGPSTASRPVVPLND